jgi:hypothetical protein
MILAANRGLISGVAQIIMLRERLQEQSSQTNGKAPERTLMAIHAEWGVLILIGRCHNKTLWIEGKRLIESCNGLVRLPNADAHHRSTRKEKAFENEVLLYRTHNPFGLLKSEALLDERLRQRVRSSTGNPFTPYRVAGRKPR